jgi:uncharacterized YigZ family protein
MASGIESSGIESSTAESSKKQYEPAGEARAEIEIKKSRFIALACRVESAEEARSHLNRTKTSWADASHVVHAFLTRGGDIFGFSDDREPSGTAGRPVLEVLKGSGVDNLMVMVVRYFGGTKLGTGGLVKAYTEATKAVIAKLPIRKIVVSCRVCCTIGYEIHDPVKKLMSTLSLDLLKEDFDEQVHLSALIPESSFVELADQIRDISSGRSFLEKIDAE